MLATCMHVYTTKITSFFSIFKDDIPTVLCSDAPCENGGTCIPINNTYTCLCRDGYEGEHCSDDVDMCRHISPCYNGATCINSGANAYHCQCTSGYNGTHCEDTATGI